MEGCWVGCLGRLGEGEAGWYGVLLCTEGRCGYCLHLMVLRDDTLGCDGSFDYRLFFKL